MYLSKATLLCGLTFNCVKSQMKYIPLSGVLMGSDSCSLFGPQPVPGNNFSISFSAKSKNDADDKFAKLSRGGQVTMPMQDMFWGSYFGALTDRFGINWMVSHGPPEG